MKQKQFQKAIALLLLGSMMSSMAVSADAAWIGSAKKNSEFFKMWDSQLREYLSEKGNDKNNKNNKNDKNNKNNKTEEESITDTETDVSVENDTSAVIDSELTVIEDATTVENPEMLRASTYSLRSAAATLDDDGTATAAENGNITYFNTTLYNYDADTINGATHRLEADAGVTGEWKGMYFNDGSPDDTSEQVYSYSASASSHTNLTWAQVQSGTYYADEACTTKVSVTPIVQGAEGYSAVTVTGSNLWENAGGIAVDTWYKTSYYYYNSYYSSYHPVYIIDYGYGYYYVAYEMQGNMRQIGYYYDYQEVSLYEQAGTIIGYTLTAGGTTLATLDGTDTSAQVGVTLYSPAGTQTLTLPYADWNHWDKAKTESTGNEGGQKFYTGLVEPTLDANKDIIFTHPEGGIFNSDATVKSIYTNVQLPFLRSTDTEGHATYTFDASVNGVYFYEDATQGSSGTHASNTRLYFAENNTQGWYGMNYGDGSQNLWAPFNEDNITGEGMVDYHFGMRTTIPFTMTTNGRLNENDPNNTSPAINFSFSGDDDVWVFIDGYLVIDLGGIHNRLDADIDFAANTVTYSVSNAKKDEFATGSYNDSTFALTQNLFGNLIPQDRASFAAKDSHELTIFYLERGAGSSNCKIEFNLPAKDAVTVQKIVDEQMVVEYVDSTFKTSIEDIDLSAELLAVLNNLDFGFILYKDGTPMANTTYNLISVNGQAIGQPSTDANGHFTLKNGQTAKFVGEFDNTAGNTYYVVEDIQDGFIRTTTSSEVNSAGDSSTTAAADPYEYYTLTDDQLHIITNKAYTTPLKSDVVHVVGGAESEDSVAFVFENYMNASLPRPSALPNDDRIVIDYGLPVVVSPVDNDLYLGESYTIDITTTNPRFGTIAKDAKDPTKFIYTLNQQMTGVEKIGYKMTATATGTTETATAEGTAYIYIIPATTMYYEEDFGDMVAYNNGKSTLDGSAGWQAVGTSQTDYQEPGVVGTVGDSPYGSDAAYLNDSGDSNGSSMYVNTSAGAAQFSYTFTGTGTAFYARTTADTGLMQIKIAPVDTSTGKPILADEVIYYRDTAFIQKDNDNNINNGITLYNIPVFDTDNVYDFDTDMVGVMEYGTYQVSVIVAKANPNLNYGKDFWLDGIRVYQPLNSEDDFAAVATSAYATDGEANMVNATLRFKLLCDEDVDNNGNWDNASGNFVLFTDSNQGMLTAEEYKNIGPKNEVYLYAGQSVTFTLSGLGWDANTNKVYLGMKAPAGVGNVTIGNKTMQIKNTVDCYYDISGYGTISDIEIGEGTNKETIKAVTFTIKAGENSLISLTNVRVTGNAEFIVVNYPNIEVSGSGK